jgi:hypothetical protein
LPTHEGPDKIIKLFSISLLIYELLFIWFNNGLARIFQAGGLSFIKNR